MSVGVANYVPMLQEFMVLKGMFEDMFFIIKVNQFYTFKSEL